MSEWKCEAMLKRDGDGEGTASRASFECIIPDEIIGEAPFNVFYRLGMKICIGHQGFGDVRGMLFLIP